MEGDRDLSKRTSRNDALKRAIGESVARVLARRVGASVQKPHLGFDAVMRSVSGRVGVDRQRLPFYHQVNRFRLRHDRRAAAYGVLRSCRLSGGQRRVALTFDDGPSPENTRPLLDLLERYEARATFFVVGEQVLGHPLLTREIVDKGHELGNHSYSHPDPSLVTATELNDDLARAADAIKSVVGRRPELARPPFGKRAKELATARTAWSTVVLWSVDSGDSAGLGSARVAKQVNDHVRPGDIVLMHDGGARRPVTIEATEVILRTLRSRGYDFVSVSELVSSGDTRQTP